MAKYNLIFLFITSTFYTFGQNVGIGTNMPNEKLHVSGKVRVDSLSGNGIKLITADSVGTLEKLPAGANGEVITQTSSGLAYMKPVAFNSVSLSSNLQFNNTTWADISGITVTFQATQTDAMIMFSASGFAFTNSMAFVQFRILDGSTSLGGTNTNMQNYDDMNGSTSTWSCSFTKKITGLVIGNTYTYKLQGQVGGVFGNYDAAIFAVTEPDVHHLTLTVMQ